MQSDGLVMFQFEVRPSRQSEDVIAGRLAELLTAEGHRAVCSVLERSGHRVTVQITYFDQRPANSSELYERFTPALEAVAAETLLMENLESIRLHDEWKRQVEELLAETTALEKAAEGLKTTGDRLKTASDVASSLEKLATVSSKVGHVAMQVLSLLG